MTIQNQIPFLYRVAYKYTNQSTIADDLVQETIYKALKNINSFKKGTNLRAWLSTILRNNFINEYRKKSKYFSTDNIIGLINKKDGYVTNNEGESMMQIELMSQAISTLPTNLKESFMLFLKGYSYKEIAEKHDAPIGTIKSRIHLARKSLKIELAHLRAA